MTPGFAKTRQELPWLYYPEADSVIINSHNFGGAFSPAVNGKMPIATWIESLDPEPTSSTIITDLVGSYDGEMTDMDPATDRVADTEVGGIRALDFDGVNDYIQFASPVIDSTQAFSVSLWFKADDYKFARLFDTNNNVDGFIIWWQRGGAAIQATSETDDSGVSLSYIAELTLNQWYNVVVTAGGAGGGALYVDGVLVASVESGFLSGGDPSNLRLATDFIGHRKFNGRMDDIRVWNGVTLDATDAADLATGRGANVA